VERAWGSESLQDARTALLLGPSKPQRPSTRIGRAAVRVRFDGLEHRAGLRLFSASMRLRFLLLLALLPIAEASAQDQGPSTCVESIGWSGTKEVPVGVRAPYLLTQARPWWQPSAASEYGSASTNRRLGDPRPLRARPKAPE